jgi:hypothetical protein
MFDKNKNTIHFIFFLSLLILNSCDLFKTRNPQEPEDNSISFLPATSPNILFSNFTQSFVGLNTENYYDCFVKIDNYFAYDYTFLPEPNALARFSGVFSQWNAQSERTFLIGLKSNIEKGFKPELIWSNGNYEAISPDSAIYLSEYQLQIFSQKKLEYYSGIARLSFIRSNNGIWYIKTWQDISTNQSDTSKTWSILKAQISL